MKPGMCFAILWVAVMVAVSCDVTVVEALPTLPPGIAKRIPPVPKGWTLPPKGSLTIPPRWKNITLPPGSSEKLKKAAADLRDRYGKKNNTGSTDTTAAAAAGGENGADQPNHQPGEDMEEGKHNHHHHRNPGHHWGSGHIANAHHHHQHNKHGGAYKWEGGGKGWEKATTGDNNHQQEGNDANADPDLAGATMSYGGGGAPMHVHATTSHHSHKTRRVHSALRFAIIAFPLAVVTLVAVFAFRFRKILSGRRNRLRDMPVGVVVEGTVDGDDDLTDVVVGRAVGVAPATSFQSSAAPVATTIAEPTATRGQDGVQYQSVPTTEEENKIEV